jgi:hypothetical protein
MERLSQLGCFIQLYQVISAPFFALIGEGHAGAALPTVRPIWPRNAAPD